MDGFSKGAWKECMAKLNNIYSQAGGEANLDVEAELMKERNITSFDSLKLLLAKKMQLTREKIHERDTIMDNDKNSKRAKKPQNRTDLIEINNKIRTMFAFMKRDFEQLSTMHDKSRSQKSLLKVLGSRILKDNKRLENDNEIFLRQISDLELFQKHLDEIEGLFRLPFGGTSNNKKKTSGDDDHTDLLDGADDEREKNKPLLDNMVLESGLPKDARFSNLPQIDITSSMKLVEDNKKLIDQGLDLLSEKLSQLKGITTGITQELDDQEKIVDKVTENVDDKQDKLGNVNRELEATIGKVSNTTIYVIILGFLVITGIILFVGGCLGLFLFKMAFL